MAEFLLIDGSYYLFYRYYALLQWWKHARADVELGVPVENKEFMERFEKTFVSKIGELIKKLKLEKPVIIVGQDCPRLDIWRMELFDKYKVNRAYEDDWEGVPVFKFSYDEKLFKKAGAHVLLRHPRLEADDCLALIIRSIRGLCPMDKIYIVTSDLDYLQLADENTIPINLKYKLLTDSKNSFKDKDKDLFCKIVTGDKSDDIPGVFKRCGIKTAAKYYDDPELFEKKLQECDGRQRYELNRKLIDFRQIPEQYVREFNTGAYTVKYKRS